MLKPNEIFYLFLVFCEFIFHVKSIPCRGRASYHLQFQAEWTNETSRSRPDGARFSGLIGCSHNKCYQMWKTGERASPGVKDVAEKGWFGSISTNIKYTFYCL